MSGNVIVLRRCVSGWGDVMVMGEMLRVLGRCEGCQICASHQGGVKCIRRMCHLMKRYDGHRRDVRGFGEV